MQSRSLIVFTLSACAGLIPAHAEDASNSKIIGPYGVELVLGPAEKSMSMGAMTGSATPMPMTLPASASSSPARCPPGVSMVQTGGATMIEPADLSGYRHLVVFVYNKDSDVQDAKVRISYATEDGGKMIELPVARMYDSRGGIETTHYGNNAKMKPGDYKVTVIVNGSSGDFKIDVK